MMSVILDDIFLEFASNPVSQHRRSTRVLLTLVLPSAQVAQSRSWEPEQDSLPLPPLKRHCSPSRQMLLIR